MIQVDPKFLQKVVGFATATNEMIEKAAADKSAIKTAADKAVGALEKIGYCTSAQKNQLVTGIVNSPAGAVELVEKLAEELATVRAEKAAAAKPKEEAPVSSGAAGESDDKTKRASELRANTTKVASASARKESDQVWESGFGLR